MFFYLIKISFYFPIFQKKIAIDLDATDKLTNKN